jgi:hypothetical protein
MPKCTGSTFCCGFARHAEAHGQVLSQLGGELGEGATEADLLDAWAGLTPEDIRAAAAVSGRRELRFRRDTRPAHGRHDVDAVGELAPGVPGQALSGTEEIAATESSGELSGSRIDDGPAIALLFRAASVLNGC